jgi:choline dehydrogenase-like flavoprotein
MIYIVGSGAAGVSAAFGLVEGGFEVTMLDVGFELERERAEVVQKLASLDKKDWGERLLKALKENMTPKFSGIPNKYVYGSDFPYRRPEYHPVVLKNAKMYLSLAKGGLLNAWGASMLPFRQEDIEGWPITIKDLEPHYKAVLSLMDNSITKDSLNAIFPTYSGGNQPLLMCRQASFFLQDLENNKEILKSRGFFFGRSRLAVRFREEPKCAYCGLCLYGCPYDCIYVPQHTLKKLSENKNFHYIKDIFVERVCEKKGEVKIEARDIHDSSRVDFTSSHCILAAGVLSSTRILLSSLEAFDHSLELKHSEYFIMPMLRYAKTKGVTGEELHTLAQVYIEIMDESISKNMVHLQVYGYNDFYLQLFKPFLGPFTPIFADEILGRLLIVQGYLHSNISSSIKVSLEGGDNGRLLVEGLRSLEANRAVEKIARKLFMNKKYLKAIPIPKMWRIGLPGDGNHSGGSFPMEESPKEFETDRFGRPYGFEKLHVVDSTIFPSIPATTVTLTIMANAHRIASEI